MHYPSFSRDHFWLKFRGGSRKFRKGVAGTLAHLSSEEILFFSENSITIIQNFKEKGVAAAYSAPRPLGPLLNPPLKLGIICGTVSGFFASKT